MSNLKPQISEKLKTILTYSNEEASRLRSKQLGVEHILLGILRQGDNVVTDLLSSHFEINPYDVRKQLEAWIDEHEPKNATFAPASGSCIWNACNTKRNWPNPNTWCWPS